MKSLRAVLFLSIALLFISGCAASKLELVSSSMRPVSEVASADVQKIDLLLEPYECVGLKLTPSIKKGEVTIYRGIMPDVLFGEFYPGRIRWNGIAVQEDGQEFFAQFLLSPPDWSGNFLWTIVVDGNPYSTAKVAVLSTLVEFLYSATGEEFSIEKRKLLLDDEEFRRKFVSQRGTPLEDLKEINKGEFYEKVLLRWNAWGTDKGKLLSPLGLDEVKEIAAINPQYGFGQKLIAEGNFSLCADYIATAVGIGIDVFRAANGNVPSAGWDFNSEFPNRRNMGLIIEYVSQMRKNLIADINRSNALIGRRR